MKVQSLVASTVFAIAGLAVGGAQAATIFSDPTPTGELATNAHPVLDRFKAAGGAAVLSFIIDGYGSLDGQNFYEDDFTLKVNGKRVVVGTFNLGGGGAQDLYKAPTGTSAIDLDGYTPGQVSFRGGQEELHVPVDLIHGMNSFSFSYRSLAGPSHAGFQGTGDEGWGLQNIAVTGAIPEPGAWALMLVGFGGVGAALRSARSRQRTIA